jgi:ABC-type multidrug transport system fused ATPase/permease subunit
MIYSALHLDPGENVILEVRKHWIVFVGYALSMLFMALMPFLILILIRLFVPVTLKLDVSGNTSALFLFAYSIWLLSLWLSFFINWTKYYLDVWYVTEKRIITVEQRRLFVRDISNVRFDKIQDVSIDVDGFIPTLLGFGNIRVQTASEDSTEFYMSTVRHPEEVRQVIFSQHNEIGDKSTFKKV